MIDSQNMLRKNRNNNHVKTPVDKVQAVLQGWHKEKEPRQKTTNIKDALEMHILLGPRDPRRQNQVVLGTLVIISCLRSSTRLQPDCDWNFVSKFVNISDEVT